MGNFGRDARERKSAMLPESTPDPGATTPTPDPAPAPAVPAPAPAATTPPATTPPADPPLGPSGEAALRAERAARQGLEKLLNEERRKNETAEDKAKRESKEREDAATLKLEQGTTRLRQANTLLALQTQGVTGPSALAASKLIDGVEFDADDVPINLPARIAAAKTTYGEGPFGGATPPAAVPAGGAVPPGLPDHVPMHHGPRAPAGVSEDEAYNRAMKNVFPQAAFATPDS
jgi:hypothetical protein